MMDVTSRKERELRLSEEATQLRSLVESMPGVPWTYAIDDPADWRPMYIAPQVEQLLGYTAAELIAEPRFFQRLVHPDDLETDPGAGGAQHPARANRGWRSSGS